MDGYECNLLLVDLSGGTAASRRSCFLIFGKPESGEGAGLATQERAAAGNKTAAQRS